MSLFAIGDLHLALGVPEKSMEIFGGRWQDYVRKIENGFSLLSDEDLCVICGDLSWGMDLEAALPDFRFIDSLPGRKLLLKGNHDYWWATAAKMEAFFTAHGLHRLSVLHNNCTVYGEVAVCGTRGWFYEEEKGDAHDMKIMLREVQRLETSFKAANGREIVCCLHYPPKYQNHVCTEILDLLKKYEVGLCCYGHIHDKGCHAAFRGEWEGTRYKLVSADFLNFVPAKLL